MSGTFVAEDLEELDLHVMAIFSTGSQKPATLTKISQSMNHGRSSSLSHPMCDDQDVRLETSARFFLSGTLSSDEMTFAVDKMISGI